MPGWSSQFFARSVLDMEAEREPLIPHSIAQRSPLRKPTSLNALINAKLFLVNNPILSCTFLLQFSFYLAKHMVEVPTVRLFEEAVCNQYYSRHQVSNASTLSGVGEEHCKLAAVQQELATITGLKFTFDALPGLLTAMYYGSIADRLGRRFVLALCSAGTLCSYVWLLFVCKSNLGLPVRLVWVSSIFLFVGGSQRVAKSMNFTVVADCTDVTYRYVEQATPLQKR